MGDSLPFVEESMHRKTRKSRVPIHRVKFSDPNMNVRSRLMEKARVWLKEKRYDSLIRSRALVSSRHCSLKDEEVIKISQMPSLPATDAVPFNMGGYVENGEEEEGLIPLPSVTSKRGSKPHLDRDDDEIKGRLLERMHLNLCPEDVVTSEHGSVSVKSLKSNTFSVEDGQVLDSTASFGMNMDEHHIQSVGFLHDQKDPPRIIYFGNLDCRLNMEDSFSFFEKFNEGHYEEVFTEGERGEDDNMEGKEGEMESINEEISAEKERPSADSLLFHSGPAILDGPLKDGDETCVISQVIVSGSSTNVVGPCDLQPSSKVDSSNDGLNSFLPKAFCLAADGPSLDCSLKQQASAGRGGGQEPHSSVVGPHNKPISSNGLPSILGKYPASPVEQQKKDKHLAAKSGTPTNDKKKSISKAAFQKEYRPVPKKISPPVDDLLDEEDVIEVDSDDGATALFLTRDPMPSQVNPVSTLEPERMDSTPTPVS
ncbi:hypothetical protein L6452_43403 [Arctium lappa]|uniref:Uncharacterized protein n=2 Tax=Arctium lappa TaxID=4217 RepID=A0ACB8XGN7_ARCLA|nr:hypothetical protein L6452_43398 [Arctium lappa]KAI3664795.1 hypothetical protein L6452_43403 [Arctium lappa]